MRIIWQRFLLWLASTAPRKKAPHGSLIVFLQVFLDELFAILQPLAEERHIILDFLAVVRDGGHQVIIQLLVVGDEGSSLIFFLFQLQADVTEGEFGVVA